MDLALEEKRAEVRRHFTDLGATGDEPIHVHAASATLRIPEALSSTIERLREDKSWEDADLVTSVKSSDVVASGLVKHHIMLGGYVTPMEDAIGDLLGTIRKAELQARKLRLPINPKAIYVSTTNAVDGVAPTSCDPHLHQVIEQPTLHYLTRSVRRRAATS